MEKIKNWRVLLEKMKSNAYEYNNRQGPILDYKINEGDKSVEVVHGDKKINFTFKTMETVLHRWKPIKMGPLNAYYHLADAEFEAEVEKKPIDMRLVKPKESNETTPQDKLNTLTIEFIQNLMVESEEDKGKINEAIVKMKQDSSGEAYARNAGKQTINALDKKIKMNLAMLQALHLAQNMLNQSKPKPPEDSESEP